MDQNWTGTVGQVCFCSTSNGAPSLKTERPHACLVVVLATSWRHRFSLHMMSPPGLVWAFSQHGDNQTEAISTLRIKPQKSCNIISPAFYSSQSKSHSGSGERENRFSLLVENGKRACGLEIVLYFENWSATYGILQGR